MLALAVTLPAVPMAAEEARRVAYSGDRLTVHAHGVPVTEIVAEIGRQTHAEIIGVVSKPRDVNQDVEAAPLVEALGRLLVDQNFTLRYGQSGELRTIRLLGEAAPTKPSPPPVAESPEPASKRPPATRHESPAMRASRQTLPDGGRLVSVRSTHDATVTTDRHRKRLRRAASTFPARRAASAAAQ